MKTKFTLIASVVMQLLFGGIETVAQPTTKGDSININDVSVLMWADGTSFWNPAISLPEYRVPKTGKAKSIFAAALWLGGLDAGGKLHLAAETYKQTGNDFWPGPIMDSADYSPHQDSLWNRVWVVNKSTIDSFRHGLCTGIPPSIQNWPGDGNWAMGEMAHLAPYVDSDHNGYYDPAGGDYPLIRGDQALYIIYNDDRGAMHTESGGAKLKVEIHLMAYQYNTPLDTPLYQTTFLHYDIYNLSKNTYDSTYIGYWCDMDLGNGSDDYVGCDSADNYWYTYNGEPTDPHGSANFAGEYGYGGPEPPPPAQGVAYLCDTMTHFLYYLNDFSAMGNPGADTAADYYGYLKSLWKDNTHVTYGGNGYMSSALKSNYMFNGNPFTNTGWTMPNAGMVYNDVRGLSSVGPFTFAAGDHKALDIALVFARADTGNQNTSVFALGNAIQNVRTFYAAQNFQCDQSLAGIHQINKTPAATQNKITLYPNPSHGRFMLQWQGGNTGTSAYVTIYNVLGKNVYSSTFKTQHSQLSINLSAAPAGLYMYRVTRTNGTVAGQGKFIIN